MNPSIYTLLSFEIPPHYRYSQGMFWVVTLIQSITNCKVHCQGLSFIWEYEWVSLSGDGKVQQEVLIWQNRIEWKEYI